MEAFFLEIILWKHFSTFLLPQFFKSPTQATFSKDLNLIAFGAKVFNVPLHKETM